jgi:hypothetical protein
LNSADAEAAASSMAVEESFLMLSMINDWEGLGKIAWR